MYLAGSAIQRPQSGPPRDHVSRSLLLLLRSVVQYRRRVARNLTAVARTAMEAKGFRRMRHGSACREAFRSARLRRVPHLCREDAPTATPWPQATPCLFCRTVPLRSPNFSRG
jgi:hypothetical protein